MAQSGGDDAREFYVVTSFQKAAIRPGAIPRDQALRSADRNIGLIKPNFESWLDQELTALADAAADARLARPGDLSWIEAVDQHSVRLRDVADTMGYPLVSFVASNLRVLCEALRSGVEFREDVIACHVDVLLLGRRTKYLGVKPDDLPEITDGLRRMVESARLKQKAARSAGGQSA